MVEKGNESTWIWYFKLTIAFRGKFFVEILFKSISVEDIFAFLGQVIFQQLGMDENVHIYTGFNFYFFIFYSTVGFEGLCLC